jgi:hypothetical protein
MIQQADANIIIGLAARIPLYAESIVNTKRRKQMSSIFFMKG